MYVCVYLLVSVYGVPNVCVCVCSLCVCVCVCVCVLSVCMHICRLDGSIFDYKVLIIQINQ